ncbi:MAG TPA: DUF885 family protein [Vicinamibacterales bacterium]|nr:DUF885 family protein [Vicinamibacterales bacterium]
MTTLDRFFDSYYRLRPVNATFTGVHDYDDRLPDWSPDGLAAAIDEMRQLRAALQEDHPPSPDLRDTRARDAALAVSFLDVQLIELDSLHFQRGNPSLAIGEAAFGIVALITRPFAPAAQRVDAVVGRLEAMPAFLAGARRSIANGIPDEWRLKALKECDGAQRVAGDGVRRWLALESCSDDRVRAAADRACAAIDDFKRWLAAGDGDARHDRYAAGDDFLDLLIERGHWCATARRDLAASARDTLDEALANLDRRARAAASGGWPEVQDRLAAQHPSAAGYLAAFQRTWDDCRAAAVERRLVSWPDYPIRYVPIPEQTRDAAPLLYYLFYRSPAPFDHLPVHDYVVTPIDEAMPADEQRRRLRAANASVIKLNHVVHHGAIGHHLQNYRAYTGESEVGRVAAVDCASRTGMFLGGTMAEGWACYATDLMDEIGFLTPDESLAQQHTRARLAARAVVDIGLHARALSFDDAVAVYRDRVGMPADAARAEACKNSMFPGTALMYWLGTDGLHALRRSRQRLEGPAFDLRRFHDRVLSFGSIPVPLVERIW